MVDFASFVVPHRVEVQDLANVSKVSKRTGKKNTFFKARNEVTAAGWAKTWVDFSIAQRKRMVEDSPFYPMYSISQLQNKFKAFKTIFRVRIFFYFCF